MKDLPLKQSLKTVLVTSRDMILLLTIIGFFRELLATGTIHIGTLLPISFHFDLLSGVSLNTYALPIFNQVPGAFIVSSVVISVYQTYQSRKDVL
jgi:Na+-translocating ferredoxin:NAD+ oxidoreductase RnfE subunit